jgi:hypothetical protein
LQLDATPLEMGIVVAIQNSAFLVVGLPAGEWIDRLAGRMNAGMYLIGIGPAPLGGLLGGALASAVGLRQTLWIVGAGLAASCVPLLLPPLVRLRGNNVEPAGTMR